MNKKLIFAVLVFLVLVGLSGCAVRERIAINTPSDSYVWGGGDIVFYSDDHATQTARIIGESGGINATGVVTASGGMVFGGPISDNAGSFRINDNVLITGTANITGETSLGYHLSVASTITASGDVDVAGNILSTSGSVRINDTAIISGDLTLDGNYDIDLGGTLKSTSGSVRIDDNTLMTGTLGVTGTLAAGYNVTVADTLTVTKNTIVNGQLTAGNGLVVAGILTTTAPLYDAWALRLNADTLITGGLSMRDPVSGFGAEFRINDATIITGGLTMRGGNFSDDTGSVRINGNTLVTGTLGVSSQINAANGIAVTGNLTVTTLVSQTTQVVADGLTSSGTITANGNIDLAGNLVSTSGSVRINDNTLITGTLGVTGTIAGGYQLTVADNMTVTKNGTVSQQMNVGNGLVAAGGITSSGRITVSNWGLFYGIVLQPQLAQVVTASYGITPGNYSVLNLADDGGQATGTIALDTTITIVDGTHIGQFLLVFWVDADGATLTIQDNGNMQGPGNADVILGRGDNAMFFWDGTDWQCINVTDL